MPRSCIYLDVTPARQERALDIVGHVRDGLVVLTLMTKSRATDPPHVTTLNMTLAEMRGLLRQGESLVAQMDAAAVPTGSCASREQIEERVV